VAHHCLKVVVGAVGAMTLLVALVVLLLVVVVVTIVRLVSLQQPTLHRVVVELQCLVQVQHQGMVVVALCM
jgi:hypothetical protein